MLLDEIDICIDDDEPRLGPQGSRKRANASAWIRENATVSLNSLDVPKLAEIKSPAPPEKSDKLFVALRNASQETAGTRININTPKWHARAWALDRREIRGIAKMLEEKGLIRRGRSAMGPDGPDPVELTATGWEHTIQTDQVDERKSNPTAEKSLEELVVAGESTWVEFKSTIRVNLKTGQKDPAIKGAVLKSIAGFLNANGGTLIIGVKDDGTSLGLGPDQFSDEDSSQRFLIDILRDRIGVGHLSQVDPRFENFEGQRVLVVRCSPGMSAAWVTDSKTEKFFLRTGNTTNQLSPSQAAEYIKTRFDR